MDKSYYYKRRIASLHSLLNDQFFSMIRFCQNMPFAGLELAEQMLRDLAIMHSQKSVDSQTFNESYSSPKNKLSPENALKFVFDIHINEKVVKRDWWRIENTESGFTVHYSKDDCIYVDHCQDLVCDGLQCMCVRRFFCEGIIKVLSGENYKSELQTPLLDDKFCSFSFSKAESFVDETRIVTEKINASVADNLRLKEAVKNRTTQLEQQNLLLIDEIARRRQEEINRKKAETERDKLEHQVRQSQKIESIGILAGGIAHDFNNLLGIILGNIDMATLSQGKEDPVEEYLKPAKAATLRAADLTQQLLTFSKGGDPVKNTENIMEIIHESANFSLHGSQAKCHFQSSDDLWLVNVDSGQISQVIQNLIINANQAMPSGGDIFVTCCNITDVKQETLTGIADARYVKVTIRDCGIGISDKYLENIFDPYFTTKQTGSGLGLALSYSIIRKHNGYIFVESIEGDGTTFTIYLPATETLKEETVESTTEEEALCKGRLMIMDDEEMILDMTRQMLENLGYDILLAKDGTQAVELYQKSMNTNESIDLIIMDLTIPGGMGGKDALQELLAIDPDVKAIVSSGYSNDHVMANYSDHGFKGAVVKPYQLKTLEQTVHSILSE